jgi:nitroreductase
MNQQIMDAVKVSKQAQRNWDLSKTIPQEDLDALIYAAQNSPKKQMETHYALHVFTDPEKIRAIYDNTKKFSLFPVSETAEVDGYDGTDFHTEGMFEDRDGEFWQDDEYSVKNSQILANAMFVYTEDRRTVRGGTHFMAQQEGASPNILSIYEEQIDFSIGISVGQLILSAAMMGYKTGICSALDSDPISEILGKRADGKLMNAKLIIGVGYEQEGIDRRLHQETLNKDIPFDDRRTGELDGKYRFPTFDGVTDVYLNGKLV